ncbi:hypothetical protein ElyMa_001510800 [Elysia marginata]|uniref:Uncharacterized protein n=1 Tax=Elysia marginata TaxID=1093978 RepID=A0AAV4J7R5_9GAST|nr:hypothetical protein ElyMa_001510800 [Elysia marginata]
MHPRSQYRSETEKHPSALATPCRLLNQERPRDKQQQAEVFNFHLTRLDYLDPIICTALVERCDMPELPRSPISSASVSVPRPLPPPLAVSTDPIELI